ncbi:MAG: DUF2505 family protein [Myxococcales bacterium]|nr:DUF2505 family protein [Myxococcales bacterium]MCB9708892.1 DUF2505 family protein [Myxococcales bacterium]
MEFEVRHRLNIDVDGFWTHVFFDQPFNQKLYMGELGFKEYRVVDEQHHPDGKVERTVYYDPDADVPQVARKLLGDKTGYTEHGTYDPVTRRWRFSVKPDMAGDKIRIGGEFWAEPLGGGVVERVARHRIEVSMLGVGRLVEKLIEQQMRENYDQAAAFTARYLSQRIA